MGGSAERAEWGGGGWGVVVGGGCAIAANELVRFAARGARGDVEPPQNRSRGAFLLSRTPPTSDKHATTIGQQQRQFNGMSFPCASFPDGKANAMFAAPNHKSTPTATLNDLHLNNNNRAGTGKRTKTSKVIVNLKET